MTERQAVKYIGAYLWRRERFAMLLTLLFACYLGTMSSFTVDSLLRGEEGVPRALYGVLDWMYLTMFPTFGLMMNKSAWGMWRDDTYSKRLALWRAMPIPVASIVKARLLQSFVGIPIIGTVFMLLQYSLAPFLRETVSPVQWAENGLVWICYSFAAVSFYVWAELGFSGKIYCLFYFGYIAVTAILSVVFTLNGIYLFQEVLGVIERGYGGALIAGMTLVAAIAIWVAHRTTVNRIRTRSLTF
ncbi:hypothetical protein [Cohnella terricola]|uniref:ABC-2 family transporter protein n=1 Tax=Cohnella terricola TaxID=1289167 RepID=A0A559JN35_9BACL|nr:hypothetical protein [Cohnella terricola]TVY01268.1 hypothetical protein FPZ45_08965 [Cohnella terricola]